MKWFSALDKLFKAKDFKNAMDDAKKLQSYAKKLNKKNPEKSHRDALKYFGNDQIDNASAAFERAEAAADAVLSAKMAWPRPESVAPFSYLFKIVDKHGRDSRQAKIALGKWKKSLYVYTEKLEREVEKLFFARTFVLPVMIQKAKAVDAYATVLQKAFYRVAAYHPEGGARAEFWQWSEDCEYLSSAADKVHRKFQKIQKRNKKLIYEGADLIKANLLWEKWAKNEALSRADSLKKNRKAAKPKR